MQSFMKTTTVLLKTTTAFLLAGLVLGFASCKKENTDNLLIDTPVYQDYKVEYNKVTGNTTGRATFRKSDLNGVRLELTGKSSLQINSNAPSSYTNTDNYFYQSVFKGKITPLVFSFTKVTEKKFENSFSLDLTSDITLGAISDFASGKEATIIWDTKALTPDETITVTLSQNDKGTATIKYFNSISTPNKLIIQPKDITSFTAGDLKISITRTYTKLQVPKPDGVAGGRTIVSITDEKTVKLN